MLTYFIRMGIASGLLPKEPIVLAVIKNLWSDLFEINCKYNTMFIWAYSDAPDFLRWGLSIEEMIIKLKLDKPICWRYRKRCESQIAGLLYYKENHPLSQVVKKRQWNLNK